MSNEKQAYRALMNLIHNELGITKEDIQDWVQDAVVKQAEIMLKQVSVEALIQDVFRNQFRDGDMFVSNRVSDRLLQHLAPILAKQLTVGLKKEE